MSEQSFTVRLSLVEKYLFQIDFGEYGDIMTDEPPPLGDGEGPNPSAMLAASVANCMSASLLFALRKYKDDPGELKAEVTGTVERDGRYLRITGLAVELQLGVPASELKSLPKVLEQFENFCVVTRSVEQGIPVSTRVLDSSGEEVSEA